MDKEVKQRGSGVFTTRIKRLYNKDQEVISRILLVSVLISASVKRCFVSHMQDFFFFFCTADKIRSYYQANKYTIKLAPVKYTFYNQSTRKYHAKNCYNQQCLCLTKEFIQHGQGFFNRASSVFMVMLSCKGCSSRVYGY